MPGKLFQNQWATPNKILCYGCTRKKGEPVFRFVKHFVRYSITHPRRMFDSNGERMGYDRYCNSCRLKREADARKRKKANSTEYQKQIERKRRRKKYERERDFVRAAADFISQVGACSTNSPGLRVAALELRAKHSSFFKD